MPEKTLSRSERVLHIGLRWPSLGLRGFSKSERPLGPIYWGFLEPHLGLSRDEGPIFRSVYEL